MFRARPNPYLPRTFCRPITRGKQPKRASLLLQTWQYSRLISASTHLIPPWSHRFRTLPLQLASNRTQRPQSVLPSSHREIMTQRTPASGLITDITGGYFFLYVPERPTRLVLAFGVLVRSCSLPRQCCLKMQIAPATRTSLLCSLFPISILSVELLRKETGERPGGGGVRER